MNAVARFSPTAAPPLAAVYLREAGFEFLRQLRTPMFALPTLAFPLVFYALFALVLPGEWRGLHKPAYLLATYGVFGIMGPALFGFGVGLAIERQNGWLELKRVSPMPPGAYFFAKIVMSLVFALVVVLLLSATAWMSGRIGVGFDRWLLLLGTLLLGALPFCAMGLWIGTLAKGQGAIAVVNLIYLPMSVLSGLWMPIFVFPQLLQKVAVLWPAWHLAELALAAVGQRQGVNIGLHVAVLLVMTLLFLSLAAMRLRRL